MNKMPDRVWATPFDSDMDGGTYCDAAERPTSPNHDAWCYVRADLALALTEENERLREALTDALDAWDTHNKHGDPMQGWWVHDAYAALKG